MTNENKQFEADLKWVIDKCQELRSKSTTGIINFFPPKEDVYLYDELVKRKVMVEDPLEAGAYIFMEDYKVLYNVPTRDGESRMIKKADVVGVKEKK